MHHSTSSTQDQLDSTDVLLSLESALRRTTDSLAARVFNQQQRLLLLQTALQPEAQELQKQLLDAGCLEPNLPADVVKACGMLARARAFITKSRLGLLESGEWDAACSLLIQQALEFWRRSGSSREDLLPLQQQIACALAKYKPEPPQNQTNSRQQQQQQSQEQSRTPPSLPDDVHTVMAVRRLLNLEHVTASDQRTYSRLVRLAIPLLTLCEATGAQHGARWCLEFISAHADAVAAATASTIAEKYVAGWGGSDTVSRLLQVASEHRSIPPGSNASSTLASQRDSLLRRSLRGSHENHVLPQELPQPLPPPPLASSHATPAVAVASGGEPHDQFHRAMPPVPWAVPHATPQSQHSMQSEKTAAGAVPEPDLLEFGLRARGSGRQGDDRYGVTASDGAAQQPRSGDDGALAMNGGSHAVRREMDAALLSAASPPRTPNTTLQHSAVQLHGHRPARGPHSYSHAMSSSADIPVRNGFGSYESPSRGQQRGMATPTGSPRKSPMRIGANSSPSSAQEVAPLSSQELVRGMLVKRRRADADAQAAALRQQQDQATVLNAKRSIENNRHGNCKQLTACKVHKVVYSAADEHVTTEAADQTRRNNCVLSYVERHVPYRQAPAVIAASGSASEAAAIAQGKRQNARQGAPRTQRRGLKFNLKCPSPAGDAAR
ncbi:hypothetical protein JKP88DRAFT_267366 [Tribonema minus]|uniref:Uncharacterized protein n=1 Tax=Tribonema minus TaxID=303371 RepID=A0A835ZHZ8_9STRA|nr:hypothetical protein JKP88DRAFT_267366 [Tribonema minus]